MKGRADGQERHGKMSRRADYGGLEDGSKGRVRRIGAEGRERNMSQMVEQEHAGRQDNRMVQMSGMRTRKGQGQS